MRDYALKNPPQLSFDQADNRWQLWMSRGDEPKHEDRSYVCQVRYAYHGTEKITGVPVSEQEPEYDGWSAFRFFAWDAGERVELVTKAEYDGRCNDITQNEGEEAAKEWSETQTEWEVVRDDHPVFKLRDHWLAMMRLGLFVPSVTH